MRVHRRNDHWHIDWTDPSGKRHRRSLKLPASASKRKAVAKGLEFQAEVLRHIREGVRPATAPTPLSGLAAAYLDWVAVHRSASTAATYRSLLRTHVVPFFRGVDARKIDVAAIERMKAHISAKGRSASTVNTALMALAGTLDHGVRLGYLATNVAQTVEALPVQAAEQDWYTTEERDRFLGAARAEPRWWGWFAFAFHTGVRLGEIRELRWLDVDLVARAVTIQRKVMRGEVSLPKGKKVRTIPLNSVALDALDAARADATPHPDRLVWSGTLGRRRGAASARKALVRIAGFAGLEAIVHHGTRHTFCSAGARAGIHPDVLRRLAGHASIQTTMRYFHAVDADLREAVELMGGSKTRRLRVVGGE